MDMNTDHLRILGVAAQSLSTGLRTAPPPSMIYFLSIKKKFTLGIVL